MLRSSAAFFLGVSCILGLAPFAFWPIPILALVCLRFFCQKKTARQAFYLGFAFGFGYFLASVSWIYVSLHTFGGMPALLAVIITVLFCAFLAFFPAIALYVDHLVDKNQQSLWTFPFCWMGTEWIRGLIFTGFPWALIGYSQIPNGPLTPLAPIGGIYFLSLLTITGAQAIFLLITKSGWQKALLFFLILGVSILVLAQKQWTKPYRTQTVALVQGNIAQDIKWDPKHSAESLEHYANLIEQSQASIVITPESALPIFWNDLPPSYIERILRHASAAKADILLGVVEYEEGVLYNSLVNIGISGTQIYRKIHLVPFGEYVPLRPLTQWFMDLVDIPLTDFRPGHQHQPPLHLQGLQIAPNICYEDAFPGELIPRAKIAHILVNVSNDAWFGDSFAPFQHLQIAQARALELAKPLLRVTNMGPSAFIDEKGHILDSIPYNQTKVLHVNVTSRVGMTPYAFWGNWLIMALLAFWVCGQISGYLRKICG